MHATRLVRLCRPGELYLSKMNKLIKSVEFELVESIERLNGQGRLNIP